MKICVDKFLLSEGVIITQRAAASRSTIEALEGILIKTFDDYIKLSGFDLETGIECKVPAEIIEPGEIVIEATTFSDIVRKLPAEVVSIETNDEKSVKIKSGVSEFEIRGINGEDFPLIPEIKAENTIDISQKTLKDCIKKTLFSVSLNENKPVHTGTLFDIKENRMNMVSVDGYRLALRTEDINFSGELKFVVPGRTLSEVLKILKDDEKEVSIHLSEKHILFQIENFTIISRLLEGEFLNYKTAIPKENSLTSVVSTKEIIDSVDRVSLLISEKAKSPIKLKFSGNTLNISCVTTMGKAKEDILVSLDGKETEIGFNHKYLLDALKACEEEKIVIKTNGAVSPCLIVPQQGDKFLYLVLPVRLRGEA